MVDGGGAALCAEEDPTNGSAAEWVAARAPTVYNGAAGTAPGAVALCFTLLLAAAGAARV